ncbi:MAG: DUF3189 family protein [Bacillota bacterium]|jgi:hypothetical protein
MKVVYHCYGGAHASPTAAALHLGLLPLDSRPRTQDFYRLIPYYDRITRGEHGKMIKMGVDTNGHEVFVLGRRNSASMVIRAIKEFSRLNGIDPQQYYFVDVVQLGNPFMVVGGFTSRGLGFVKLGRPLVSFGTGLSFAVLVRIVRRTLAELEGKPV